MSLRVVRDRDLGFEHAAAIVREAQPPTLFDRTWLSSQPTIAEMFAEFHRINPHVYDALVKLARQSLVRGKRTGIGALFEVLRWQWVIETGSVDEFRLNNNMRSRYARLIMAQEPDLEGFFDIRELRAP
jgi:hypothetical protein